MCDAVRHILSKANQPCLKSRSPIFKACAHANSDGPLHHLPVKVQSREMAMGLEDLNMRKKVHNAQCGKEVFELVQTAIKIRFLKALAWKPPPRLDI